MTHAGACMDENVIGMYVFSNNTLQRCHDLCDRTANCTGFVASDPQAAKQECHLTNGTTPCPKKPMAQAAYYILDQCRLLWTQYPNPTQYYNQSPIEIKEGQILLDSITLSKSFHISFQLKLDSYNSVNMSQTTNILQIRTSNDSSKNSRFLGIYFLFF